MSLEEGVHSGDEDGTEEEQEEELVGHEEQEHEAEDGEAHDDGAGVGFGEEGAEDEPAFTGRYNPDEVNDQVFEELLLGDAVAQEVQGVWSGFLKGAESREAAGEAIYAALFDAAPSLQGLFKTPRAVMAMRFMNGLNQIITSLHDAKGLKTTVETLGFQHLDLEVTAPRVVIFRDAIVDLVQVEMGDACSPRAVDGFKTFLNYVGGAYIFVRVKYAERLKCLATSWAQANGRAALDAEASGQGEEGGTHEEAPQEGPPEATASGKSKPKTKSWFGGMSGGGSPSKRTAGANGEPGAKDFMNTSVPKTFEDMFIFNAAVMGCGSRTWMQEILASFDAIVTNVANSYRLQEECDVLALRMAKFKGTVVLSEFRSVMLASLRSLVKDWASLHEVSWSWLWDNVERMLKTLMGRPAKQEASLAAFLASLDESSLMTVRREVYSQFFAIAPAGQDYFKQSTTRLHFIADKLVAMTLDMYREPKRMVEDISALGLRHVGYGIPTDLFGPFVTACVQVVRMLTQDDQAEESFRWSLSLISRILVRVINEGSTIVMRAINANSAKQLRKAVGCAPRGKRALWTLNVQVGTQSISPLMWAIETGSLDAARAIIVDLLTIRADRDRYYYGMDIMFERHPDIVKRLCVDAPALLPVLLDGLIWRSRVTEGGRRRVNYYIQHLVVDSEGRFAPTVEWVTDNEDPKIVCHPVVSMVTDLVWERVAFRTFLFGKAWFLLTLVVFVLSQSVLNHLDTGDDADGYADKPLEVRLAIFVFRCFIYACSMGHWMFHHARRSFLDIRARAFTRVCGLKVPAYLENWQDLASGGLTVCLFMMLILEPILHCVAASGGDHVFTSNCPDGQAVIFAYSIASTAAMLLYFLLLSDLSVLSTSVSAYVLVCGRVLSEAALFLFGLTFFVVSFACAVSSLEQDSPDFKGLPKSGLQFYKMTLGMYSGLHYDMMSGNPALLVVTFVYVLTTVLFLVNLLIAQLNCAYQASYQDMLGFARLNRGKIVSETMPSVSQARWQRFVAQLRLDERVEFGEGDIGLAGGVQVFEPASANITTKDMIRRFGGSTSPAAQWPDEDGAGDDEDRFDRMEKLIEKAMKRMAGRRKGGGGSQSGMGSSSGMESSSVRESSGAQESGASVSE